MWVILHCLQEGCGFKTDEERTQVYKLDPAKHGDVCLAGTGEMPLAGMSHFMFWKHSSLEYNKLKILATILMT